MFNHTRIQYMSFVVDIKTFKLGAVVPIDINIGLEKSK